MRHAQALDFGMRPHVHAWMQGRNPKRRVCSISALSPRDIAARKCNLGWQWGDYCVMGDVHSYFDIVLWEYNDVSLSLSLSLCAPMVLISSLRCSLEMYRVSKCNSVVGEIYFMPVYIALFLYQYSVIQVNVISINWIFNSSYVCIRRAVIPVDTM